MNEEHLRGVPAELQTDFCPPDCPDSFPHIENRIEGFPHNLSEIQEHVTVNGYKINQPDIVLNELGNNCPFLRSNYTPILAPVRQNLRERMTFKNDKAFVYTLNVWQTRGECVC